MKRLLAVIDYQNDFVSGALGFPAAAELDFGICTRVQEFLAMGDPVLFTFDTHGAEYLNTREGRMLPVPHCDPDTEGWQLFGKTGEQVCFTCYTNLIHRVRKSTFGMHPEDALALRRAIGEVDEIHITGVVTNMCVISNAVVLQSVWPEAQIIVDAALCASFDPVLHEKALDVMEGMQMKIIHRESAK